MSGFGWNSEAVFFDQIGLLGGRRGRPHEFIHGLFAFAAIRRPLRFVVAGNTIVPKAEQHIRINEISLVQFSSRLPATNLQEAKVRALLRALRKLAAGRLGGVAALLE